MVFTSNGVTRVVGREFDGHLIVDIRPPRMVIHFFGDERHAGHECEGFAEVSKGELAGKLVIGFSPHGEGSQLIFDKSGQDSAHMKTKKPQQYAGASAESEGFERQRPTVSGTLASTFDSESDPFDHSTIYRLDYLRVRIE